MASLGWKGLRTIGINAHTSLCSLFTNNTYTNDPTMMTLHITENIFSLSSVVCPLCVLCAVGWVGYVKTQLSVYLRVICSLRTWTHNLTVVLTMYRCSSLYNCVTWRWPTAAETCRHRQHIKRRYTDSCVLTYPTHPITENMFGQQIQVHPVKIWHFVLYRTCINTTLLRLQWYVVWTNRCFNHGYIYISSMAGIILQYSKYKKRAPNLNICKIVKYRLNVDQTLTTFK
jgi:hypothetical protein